MRANKARMKQIGIIQKSPDLHSGEETKDGRRASAIKKRASMKKGGFNLSAVVPKGKAGGKGSLTSVIPLHGHPHHNHHHHHHHQHHGYGDSSTANGQHSHHHHHHHHQNHLHHHHNHDG